MKPIQMAGPWITDLEKKTVLDMDFSKYTCLCVLLQPKVRIFVHEQINELLNYPIKQLISY